MSEKREVEVFFGGKNGVRVITVAVSEIPFDVPATKNGVNVGAYSVVEAEFGKDGAARAKILQLECPDAIISYQAQGQQHLLFPKKFNPSRIKFYETKTEASMFSSVPGRMEQIDEVNPHPGLFWVKK